MRLCYQQTRLPVLVLATVLAVSFGCAPAPSLNLPGEDIDAAIEGHTGDGAGIAARQRELPPEVSSALLPSLDLEKSQEPPLSEARFDVAAQETGAREFLLGLVEGTSHNMVVHPDVEGNITLNLKNVTVREAMEVVHNVYGYPYLRTETGFQVLPATFQSRIFQVNYLNLIRKGVSQTRISSGQISESSDGDEDGGLRTVSGSQVNTETVSAFWEELRGALEAIVGTEEGRQVVLNPQAGIVVVRAMPRELVEIERFLGAIQASLQRQVILEAKILEVELSDNFQSGINWAALSQPDDNKSIVVGQVGGQGLFGNGFSDIAGNPGVLNPLSPSLPEGTTTSAFGGVFSAALSLNDFTAFIELLEGQGDVQVLSSPRISTVNNQKAVIKVGSDEFFVTDVSSTTVTGTTTTTTPEISLTPFFSGIALDVTPQIDGDGRVTLHIHPTVSEVKDQNKEITVGGQTQNIPLAFSSVRESDSIINARSGQVVVIGGLMKKQIVKERSGIPLLGDIPFVGALFRHTRSVSKKNELVILLRPVVVRSDRTWSENLDQYRRRFREIGGVLDKSVQGSTNSGWSD